MKAKARQVSWYASKVSLIVALILLTAVAPTAQAAPASASGGYWYTVQPGDTWSGLAARTGLSVATLQAANPAHLHPPYNWLYVGHVLWIPTAPPPPGYWYTVQPGDTWYSLATKTGRSVAQLQAANPAHLHPPYYWLYVGHVLWIP